MILTGQVTLKSTLRIARRGKTWRGGADEGAIGGFLLEGAEAELGWSPASRPETRWKTTSSPEGMPAKTTDRP